jgi:hypothetical protein
MKFEYNFVKPGVFDLPEIDHWGFTPEESVEIQPHWKLAHIAVCMELFPSVSVAKKNGWDGDIPQGYTERKGIGKMKKSMYIHNPPDEFLDPEYGKDT